MRSIFAWWIAEALSQLTPKATECDTAVECAGELSKCSRGREGEEEDEEQGLELKLDN